MKNLNIAIIDSNIYINEEKAKVKRCKYSTRKIYHTRDYIIKLNDDLDQSNKEYKRWKTIEKLDKKYFSEVVGYKKNSYIIHKKYSLVKNESIKVENFEHILEKLIKKYKLHDLETRYPNNWSVTKTGDLIIYDYAL